MNGSAVGWVLDAPDRARLLDRFPPRYPGVIAHHVTLWGHKKDAGLPPPADLAVTGHADAGTGIEALVVSVDGEERRPDGNIFHCTWSLDPARGLKPKDSNLLLLHHGWTAVAPLPFAATPGPVA